MAKQKPSGVIKHEAVKWHMEHTIVVHPITGCWFPPETNKQPRWKITMTEGDKRIYPYASRYFKQHQYSDDCFKWEEGMQASHLCEDICAEHGLDHGRCCNPDHIVAESRSDNQLRAVPRANYSKRREPSKRVPTGLSNEERLDWYIKNMATPNENGCIIWNDKPNKGAEYPTRKFNMEGKAIKRFIHRVICSYKYDIPYSELPSVRHTCNEKLCINTEHLVCDFDGSSARQNSIDSRETHKNTKLNEQLVRQICEDLQDKSPFTSVAEKMKWANGWQEVLKQKGIEVTLEGTLYKIARRINWKDISEEYTWEWQ